MKRYIVAILCCSLAFTGIQTVRAQGLERLSDLTPVSGSVFLQNAQVSIADHVYSQYFMGVKDISGNVAFAVYNLSGNYIHLTGAIGVADDNTSSDSYPAAPYAISVDGHVVVSGTCNRGDQPVLLDLDVTGAKVLRVTLSDNALLADPVLTKVEKPIPGIPIATQDDTPPTFDQVNDLANCATDDDIAKFRHVLSQHPSWVNDADVIGPVAVAVAGGGGKCFDYYLSLHPNLQVSAVTVHGRETPLLAAMDDCNWYRIKALMKAGASPSGVPESQVPLERLFMKLEWLGGSPPKSWDYHNAMRLAQLLVVSGANVNPPDHPLLILGICDSYDFLKLLTYHGADLTQTDQKGNTVLHLVEPIFEASPGTDWTESPWQLAADAKDAAVPTQVKCDQEARFFLSQGAKVNARNNAGETPLYVAVNYGKAGGLSGLTTPVADHEYFRKQVLPLVQVLLDHGADPNAVAADGRTPLHVAAQNGFYRAVVLMLAHGANVNMQDGDGRTALDIAALYGNADIKALLAKHGGKGYSQ